jgi:hypothetical protein
MCWVRICTFASNPPQPRMTVRPAISWIPAHAAGVASAILEDGLGAGAVADFDAHAFGGGEPTVRQADAFVFRAHHEAAGPDDLVALPHPGQGDGGFHRHLADRVHPEDGVA